MRNIEIIQQFKFALGNEIPPGSDSYIFTFSRSVYFKDKYGFSL